MNSGQMRRRKLIASLGGALCGVLLAPGAAFAQDYTAQVVAELREQGFGSIRTERTLLGRSRILAQSAEYKREIVLDPRTGEILRDLWVNAPGKPSSRPIMDGSDEDDASSSGSGSSSGGGSSSDDEDDDDEDDDSSDDDEDDDGDDDEDEDEDNSGSGSSQDDTDDDDDGEDDSDDDDEDDD